MSIEQEYKKQLLNSIPVVSAMNVDIEKVESHSIMLSAPLDTNINYEGTAFGGSLNTACVLSCYLLVHHFMKSNDIPFNSLVIQNSSINYIKPVQKDFFAKAELSEKQGDFLKKVFLKKGKGRVSVKSKVFVADQSSENLVEFEARFVVC